MLSPDFPLRGLLHFAWPPEMNNTSSFFKAWSINFRIFPNLIGEKWYLPAVLICISVMSEAEPPSVWLRAPCLCLYPSLAHLSVGLLIFSF